MGVLRADMLLVYKLFGLVHVNSNAVFTLSNQPHLRSQKYVICQQRVINRIRGKFFPVTEWLIYGTIYHFVQKFKVSVNLTDQ